MNEEEDIIPENTCETIQITKDILRLFEKLEIEYTRIKGDIKEEIMNSLKPKDT